MTSYCVLIHHFPFEKVSTLKGKNLQSERKKFRPSHLAWKKYPFPFKYPDSSTSLGETFLAWRFILNENTVVLIDHILSETICLFCFCVLFSNMYPKIKFTAKIWSDLCNYLTYVKWFVLEFLSENFFFVFYFSLMNLNNWCFGKILWKFTTITW